MVLQTVPYSNVAIFHTDLYMGKLLLMKIRVWMDNSNYFSSMESRVKPTLQRVRT
jgi:hypothetical protein